MRTNYFLQIIFVFTLVSFMACGPRNPSLSQMILGKWDIENINIGTDEMLENDNPPFVNSEGWIEFHTDNTFDSQGEPLGIIDGEWKIDEEAGVLSISVNQNLSDKSTWDISVEKKKMDWSNSSLNVTMDLIKS